MNIPVSKEHLKSLEEQARRLQALEAGGVDNWEGYEDAMQPIWKREAEVDLCSKVLDEICEILCESTYEPSERGAGFTFTGSAQEEALEILISHLKPKEVIE